MTRATHRQATNTFASRRMVSTLIIQTTKAIRSRKILTTS